MAIAKKCFDFNGKEFNSISEMCRFHNINVSTFNTRRNNNVPFEQCFSKEKIKPKKSYSVGDEKYNYQGLKMKIISDNGNDLIDVEFDDGYIRKNAHASEFINGTIRNHMVPELYGVGILGDIKTKENGKFIKEYSTWSNILQRCYSKEKQEEFPRYKDCSICDEWLYFPNFYNWCHEQSNWNKVVGNPKDFHIDKDILIKENKIYSPSTCCFVPFNVNILFTKGNAMRGNLPIGVSLYQDNKYRARYGDPVIGKTINKYGFKNPDDAFAYYKQKKEEVIKKVANIEYKNKTITKECYNAMMNYEVEITD